MICIRQLCMYPTCVRAFVNVLGVGMFVCMAFCLRIKQESEEKLLKERQELLSQLEELQESKQAEYQLELQRLAKEMVGVACVMDGGCGDIDVCV